MKHFSQILLFLLCATVMMAAPKAPSNKAVYDDLHYTIDLRMKTAVVDVNPKLSGDIVIPEQIEHNNELFTVIGVADKAFKGGKGITSFTLPSTIRFVHRSAFMDSEWYNNEENWGEKGALYIDSILISVNPDSTKSKYYILPGTTAIAVGALLDCKDIMTQVWIPNTVTEIAPGTFKGCKSLRKFHFGQGVKRIGKDAFVGTAAYENEGNWKKGVLYLDTCLIEGSKDMKPDYVCRPGTRIIADAAFKDNKVLHHIVLDPRVKIIGDETFSGCAQLEHVDMTPAVVEIGNYAFTDCQNIKEINLSPNVKSIGLQCFSGCMQLERFKFPKAIKDIPDATFYRCVSLGEIKEWPSELKEIGKGAFRDCSQLLEIKNLPTSLRKVGEGAFAGCSTLQEVTLPDSVIQISSHMFDGCAALRKARFSENVYDISDYAFRGCIMLETFHMPAFTFRIGDYAFLNCTALREIRLVDYIEVIEPGAFMNCPSLERLDLPLRLLYLDKQVFAGCKSLREVNFHTKFNSIADLAFENCTLLKKVYLPEGCEVSKDAFKGCKTEIKYIGQE